MVIEVTLTDFGLNRRHLASSQEFRQSHTLEES